MNLERGGLSHRRGDATVAGAEIDSLIAKKSGGFLCEIHHALFWHPLQRMHRMPNSIADYAAASAHSPWKASHNRSNFRRSCETRPSDSPNRSATALVLSPPLNAQMISRSRSVRVWSQPAKSMRKAAKSGTGTFRSAMTACCQPLAISADRDSKNRLTRTPYRR